MADEGGVPGWAARSSPWLPNAWPSVSRISTRSALAALLNRWATTTRVPGRRAKADSTRASAAGSRWQVACPDHQPGGRGVHPGQRDQLALPAGQRARRIREFGVVAAEPGRQRAQTDRRGGPVQRVVGGVRAR